VISGLDSNAARARESEAIVNWAFRQFSEQTLGTAGTQLAEASVAMGAQPKVGLELAEDLKVLTPISTNAGLQGEIIYEGPFRAPVTKGDVLAELVLTRDGLPEVRVPLVASQSVDPGGFMVKVTAAALHLLERLNAGPQDAS
jgi:D-alanyl-D-alanine carboxypeptidase (penicillin-binding protein 5/6)